MKIPSPTPGAALLAAVILALPRPGDGARAQPALDAPLIYQSVEGSLELVNPRGNTFILKGTDGKRHSWRLGAAVIKEAARYKEGDPMWVIYRQVTSTERGVTALGFPGSEEKPHYVNATGDRVTLRTGPYVEGACRAVAPDVMKVHELRTAGEIIDDAPCWCCASGGKSCDLANRSHDLRGTGRIVLARCFP